MCSSVKLIFIVIVEKLYLELTPHLKLWQKTVATMRFVIPSCFYAFSTYSHEVEHIFTLCWCKRCEDELMTFLPNHRLQKWKGVC